MAVDESLDILLTHLYSWPAVRRGGERYLHELAAGLVRAGHRATILSSADRRSRGVVEGVPVRWIRARQGPRRFGAFGPEVAFGAAALLSARARRPMVWHALGTADAAAATVGGPRSPGATVYTDLGIPVRAYRESREDFGLFLRVVAGIGSYITLTQHVADQLRSGFGREADVVPGGIRLASFRPGSRDARPTLLYAGTFSEPRKNVKDLLAAAVLMRRTTCPDVQVWLSGPGDPDALVRSVAGADGVVTRAGMDSRDELASLYATTWVTVLPSVDEAQGLTVLESLASGTPAVVRRDGGGPPELVDECTGVLSGPSVEDLAEALSHALALSQGAGTGEACRSRAEAYDWDRVIVPRVVELYREQLRA